MSSLLFISCEQLYTSAGDLILKITNPIEKKFKYADMRLWIDSTEVRKASEATRKQMAWDTIARALDNIRKKRHSSVLTNLKRT